MTKKKRILQPVNLIVFLIFALAAEVVVCMPLFEGANVGLQIGWTCYLLIGILFLFFVGEKIAKIKIVKKCLIDSKAGRILFRCFLFLLCIGIGGAFRIWEIPGGIGSLSKTTILNLVYYLIIGLLVYFTARQINGFRSGVAAILLLILCPFFDFSAEISLMECMYVVLTFTAVFSISLANYFVEKKSVSLPDTLLTILGAISLAGAAFLHISAMVLIFPCIFLLIRKSGLAIRGKREQRGLRSLLFEMFFICSLVVIALIYSVENRNAILFNLPIDYDLLHIFGNIGKEPMHVISALLDKFTELFTIYGQREYYNGLLMGMLILGIVGAILLFRKKEERRFFPVYLFNWYFFFGILLKEFDLSGLMLYVLLVYIAAGAVSDFSEIVFAGKNKEQEPEAVEEAEAEEPEEEAEAEEPEEEAVVEEEQPKAEMSAEPEPVVEAKAEESEAEAVVEAKAEESEPEAVVEAEAEEPESETIVEAVVEEEPPKVEMPAEPELKAVVEEEPPKEEMPAESEPVAEAEKEEPEAEAVVEAETEEPEPETIVEAKEEPKPEKAAKESEEVLSASLEKQMQDLIKREDRILEIVEKQNVQISRLEEVLREQSIRAKQMERHYRKELAIARNKKR